MKNETSDYICAILSSEGWREYPDQFKKYARAWFKRFDTPTRCCGNDDNPGQQVCIYVYEDSGVGSVDMDLYAELSDETWMHIHNYGLRRPISEVLKLIPRLIATWEFVANYKP